MPVITGGHFCDACHVEISGDVPAYRCVRPASKRQFGADPVSACDYDLCTWCYNDPEMSTLCKLVEGAVNFVKTFEDGMEGQIPGRWDFPYAWPGGEGGGGGRSSVTGMTKTDGLGQALNGTNHLRDGVETRAIQDHKGDGEVECDRATSDERQFARLTS
jgi:hypothetical protein